MSWVPGNRRACWCVRERGVEGDESTWIWGVVCVCLREGLLLEKGGGVSKRVPDGCECAYARVRVMRVNQGTCVSA